MYACSQRITRYHSLRHALTPSQMQLQTLRGSADATADPTMIARAPSPTKSVKSVKAARHVSIGDEEHMVEVEGQLERKDGEEDDGEEEEDEDYESSEYVEEADDADERLPAEQYPRSGEEVKCEQQAVPYVDQRDSREKGRAVGARCGAQAPKSAPGMLYSPVEDEEADQLDRLLIARYGVLWWGVYSVFAVTAYCVGLHRYHFH